MSKLYQGQVEKNPARDKLEQKGFLVDQAEANPSMEVLHRVDSPHMIESNEKDIVLWKKIKKGDTKALGDLYDFYIPVLFPYGITLCSNKVLVMDSIHDLFVDLFKYRKKLADEPQVKYYLLKSLKRMIYKKAGKKEAAFEKLEENNFVNIDFAESSAEKKLIEFENVIDQEQRIARALSGLSKKQKMAVQLKFYQGKSYEEIAGLMNVTVETSRTLIYRSMISLRQILSNSSVMLLFYIM